MKTYNRRSIYEELKDYCVFAEKDDYIEVTEWANGEGYDIEISTKWQQSLYQLSHGEFRLLKKLIKALEKQQTSADDIV